jgi:hypothetical protein
MKCLNCNKEIEKDSKFCAYCGKAIKKSEDEPRSKENYQYDLKEWQDYITEYGNDFSPINKELQEELKDLGNKKKEAKKTGDKKKVLLLWKLEADKCNEIIKALRAMHVPEIAKEYHDYFIKSFVRSTQGLLYIIKKGYAFEEFNFEAQNLLDESHQFYVKADQELLRIKRSFNKRAKNLNLSIPYPDLD